MDFIYTLNDPRDNQIRYVGKTDNPERRLKGHLVEHYKCYRTNWIQSLVALGLKPTMNIIEQVAPNQNWEDRERFWIKYYRDAGCNLTNGTDGGDRGPDMKGKPAPKSEQARANIIAALVKRNKSPEMRERSRQTGYRVVHTMHTPEAIEKRRIKQIGKHVHTDEFKRALAERNKTRKYDSEKMSANARRLWDDPIKSISARKHMSEIGKRWLGVPKISPISSEKASINSHKLWDDPIKGAEARAKLKERNKLRHPKASPL